MTKLLRFIAPPDPFFPGSNYSVIPNSAAHRSPKRSSRDGESGVSTQLLHLSIPLTIVLCSSRALLLGIPQYLHSGLCLVHFSQSYSSPLYSKNHRIIQNGRDMWMSSSTSPSEEGSVMADCSGLHEYLHGWKLHNSPGNLFHCLMTLVVKKCFLEFRWNFMYFELCPSPLVLCLGTTEKTLAASASCPPRYSHTLVTLTHALL